MTAQVLSRLLGLWVLGPNARRVRVTPASAKLPQLDAYYLDYKKDNQRRSQNYQRLDHIQASNWKTTVVFHCDSYSPLDYCDFEPTIPHLACSTVQFVRLGFTSRIFTRGFAVLRLLDLAIQQAKAKADSRRQTFC